MNSVIIDSSGWLEYFGGGPKAKAFRKYIVSRRNIITPTLVLYEVYKKIAREKSPSEGILAVTQIGDRSEYLVSLDTTLALFAADISLQKNLAMADSVIYAATLQAKAQLITGDHHFKDLEHAVVV